MFLFAVDVMYKCYEAKALGEVFLEHIFCDTQSTQDIRKETNFSV